MFRGLQENERFLEDFLFIYLEELTHSFQSFTKCLSCHTVLLNGLVISTNEGSIFFWWWWWGRVLSQTSTTHRTAEKGRGYFFLTPLYHFHPLHAHLLEISRVITAESSPLHIALPAGLKSGTFGFRTQVINYVQAANH